MNFNVLPWILVAFLGGLYVNQYLNKSESKVIPNTVVTSNLFNDIVTKDEAAFLISVSDNISNFISKDDRLLTKRQNVLDLIENCGIIFSYDNKIPGLGDVLIKYFDEESEFPQLAGDLTVEDKLKAYNAWQKISSDLKSITSYKVKNE